MIWPNHHQENEAYDKGIERLEQLWQRTFNGGEYTAYEEGWDAAMSLIEDLNYKGGNG